MPMTKLSVVIPIAACALLPACASTRSETSTHAPTRFTDDGVSVAERPGPAVGQRLGEVRVMDVGGNEVTLASLYRLGPIVVTFYRGGWCPYCAGALTEWEGRTGELTAMGVQFIAITPEKPDLAAQTAGRGHLEFPIYTDHRYEAADRFRLRFSMSQADRETYRGYGIDLEQANAAGRWDLPAPGTFIVDVNGVVRYAFAEWDYTKRADPDDVIAAAREVVRMEPTRTR